MGAPVKPKQPPAIWVRTSQLVPWIDNPKIHGEDQIARLCASITETARDAARERGEDPDADPSCVNLLDGWGNPLQIRMANREIIAGHGRLLAADRLGIEWVPCRPMGISERQAHRLARADNRIAELAEWDEEKLLAQLQDDMPTDDELAHLLDEAERDAARFEQLHAQGFDQGFLDALLEGKNADEPGTTGDADGAADGELEDPPVGEPPKNPVTKLGDVWELGRHVLACGSVMDGLPFADGEAQTCVTSPPYWGLRDYGEEGQLGLEKTPEKHCERMVQVYREVRRVLRGDATAWMNYGDCYAPSPAVSGLKPKDLVGMPWMIAFALRADGWWLRQDNIWSKPNPMPESATDRCTKAHEYVFLFAAAARYYYDADAIREPNGKEMTPAEYARRTAPGATWQPYAEAHFATYPPDLIVPCIKAGTSERGCCSSCGAPWVRVVDAAPGKVSPQAAQGQARASAGAQTGGTAKVTLRSPPRDRTTTGWQPSCKCDAAPEPCTVLDPFMGAGTTIIVAEQLNRKAIGTELSPAYCDIIVERWQQLTGGKAKRRRRAA